MPAAAIAAGALVGLAGLGAPRVAYRLSVEYGSPPRAGCDRCAHAFPRGLAGWVRVGARCAGCRTRLGPPTWLTGLAGALAGGVLGWCLDPATVVGRRAAGVATAAGAVAVLAAFLVVAVVAVLLAAIDLACLRLPDVLVGPALLAALALLGIAAAVDRDGRSLLRAGFAAAALAGGYLVLALLPGANLGLGDVKLCAVLGLLLGWLGWGAVLLGAVLPHLINGPIALGLLLTGRAGRKTELPLGPALLAGALLAVVGHTVLRG